MKKNLILVATAAMLLAGGLTTNVEAAENEGASASTFMPSPKKKTTKKSTAKKSTTKKTTAKKSTAKSTATKTTTTAETATSEAATSNSSSAQSVVGGLLGGLLGGGSSSSSSSSSSALGGLASALTTIFDGSKTASADKLVGTWKYTEPAVVFESNNALKNIGGKVASAAIEKKLQTELEKFGIKKGKMKMTFDKDGNFTQTLGKQTFSGTYTTSGKNVVLTYNGGIKQLIGTTQLDGNNLLIVMDAGKLLKYAGSLGKLTGNSTVSTLSSLLGSYDGMEVGVTLQK